MNQLVTSASSANKFCNRTSPKFNHFSVNNQHFFILFPKLSAVNNEIIIIATLLMFSQIVDGFFTLLGLGFLGNHSEGNAFIREAIYLFGPVGSIIIAKSLAILAILFLTFQSNKMRLIRPFFVFALGIYYTCALLPWASIIGHYLARIT